jgi:hypothetical protein
LEQALGREDAVEGGHRLPRPNWDVSVETLLEQTGDEITP